MTAQHEAEADLAAAMVYRAELLNGAAADLIAPALFDEPIYRDIASVWVDGRRGGHQIRETLEAIGEYSDRQIAEELQGCLSLVKIIFGTLGMTDYRVRVGLRDSDSTKYVGDPANWKKAEEACREVLALPIYPELSAAQQDELIGAVTDFYRS